MSDRKFKYFRDPDNFASKVDAVSPCSICEAEGLWFDARGFYGFDEIDCICPECLAGGRLEALEIRTNQASYGGQKDIDIIEYRTPHLPTWQEREWPHLDGSYCVFERLASKQDFASKDEFQNSLSEEDREDTDLDWLWDRLPDKRITDHRSGFDVSVYLFTLGDRKHCLWDMS